MSDKPEPTTCPTCGGLCERLSEEEEDELRGCARAYHSLVKGEVVAEGNATPIQDYMPMSPMRDRQIVVYLDWTPEGSFPVLVIRKQDSMGGKE